jgi:hypothetical protein
MIFWYIVSVSNLGGRGLENHWALLGRLCERYTQFEQFSDDGSEVLEEERLIFRILVHPQFERLIRDQSHIRR